MTAPLDPHAHIAMLQGELQSANRELSWARLKIQSLLEALRRERIDKYGPRSETLSDLQLSLLDEEPGVTGEEVAANPSRDGASCRRICRAKNK